MTKMLARAFLGLAAGTITLATIATTAVAQTAPGPWRLEWPNTDFTRHSVDLSEIMSGGPPRDGIPSIDDPVFVPVGDTTLTPTAPVLSLEIAGDARAYPLEILIWHEIVNDDIGGLPVAVTYCPLCNSGVVFHRVIDGQPVEFGTTGKLRHSDMVMYDRLTESWWQQFLGEAIVGELTGTVLDVLPSRLESIQRFAARRPDGRVLVPNDPGFRPYGRNPYVGYDRASAPMLYRGTYDGPGSPMMRVVAVGDEAWSLELLRQEGTMEIADLRLSWSPGQASALDAARVDAGRDVGNVVVERRMNGEWVAAVHDIPFAFAFRALIPDGEIHHTEP